MNEHAKNTNKGNPGSSFEKGYAPYVIGFVSSVVLTLLAYYLSVDNGRTITLAPWLIVFIIIVFALIQFAIQLIFFMHLRILAAPRWKFLVFLFMFLIVIVLVAGSLWIMHSLDSRMMMTTAQEKAYMDAQIGL